MGHEAEVRTDEGKLVGYRCIRDGMRMLGLVSKKGNYIGSIAADKLYMKLKEGPCIDIEEIKNQEYR